MKRLLSIGLVTLLISLITQFVVPVIGGPTNGLPVALAVIPDGTGGGGRCVDDKGVTIGVPLEGNDRCAGNEGDNPIIEYLKTGIRLASGVFGLVVILMIIISGIQYIISQGDPNNVKTAKSRLNNAVIGLILFIMTYAVLEYLIPGTIFGS